MDNIKAKLGTEALAWADRFTGLSGDFDKDFASQLKSTKQSAPGRR